MDIDFDAGVVYVDGEQLQEDYINNLTHNSRGVSFPLTVEEDCLFVLGDNRSVSLDSRYCTVNIYDGEVSYITPGAAILAELSANNVIRVEITVELPLGRTQVGISEVKIIGR